MSELQAACSHAFQEAAYEGNLRVMKLLISMNTEKEILVLPGADHDKAFLGAVQGGHLHVVMYLVALSKHNNTLNPHVDDDVAFLLACRSKNLPMAKYLVSESFQPNAKNHAAFAIAAQNGDLNLLKFLMDLRSKGYYLDPSVNDGEALKIAAEKGYKDMVNILLYSRYSDPVIPPNTPIVFSEMTLNYVQKCMNRT